MLAVPAHASSGDDGGIDEAAASAEDLSSAILELYLEAAASQTSDAQAQGNTSQSVDADETPHDHGPYINPDGLAQGDEAI